MRACSLLLGASFVLALLPCEAGAAPQAGVAAAVRGEVRLDRAGAVGVDVESGAPIYLEDEIRTGPDAGLQILLLDETVFTLGPESDMVIDSFVYSGDPARDELGVELVRGTFRFVSGRIAKQKPETMRVGLPSGTIGIRGTIVNAAVDDGSGRSLVMLAGPGGNQAAGIAPGSISVTNAGTERLVFRPGYGVEIPRYGEPPGVPFLVPPDAVPAFATASPGGPSGSGANGSPASTPGAQGAGPASSDTGGLDPDSNGSGVSEFADADADQGLDGAELLDRTLGQQLLAGDTARDSSQDEDPTTTTEGGSGGTDPPTIVMPPTTTVTQVDDLVNLAGTFSGIYVYTVSALALSLGGTVDVDVKLDFSTSQVNFALANLQSSAIGEISAGMGSSSLAFTSVTGDARYMTSISYMGSACSPCPASVTARFDTTDSQVAAEMTAVIAISDPDFVQTEMGTISSLPVRITNPPR